MLNLEKAIFFGENAKFSHIRKASHSAILQASLAGLLFQHSTWIYFFDIQVEKK